MIAWREKFFRITGISIMRAIRNSTNHEKEYASVADALNDFTSGTSKAVPSNYISAMSAEDVLIQEDAKRRLSIRPSVGMSPHEQHVQRLIEVRLNDNA